MKARTDFVSNSSSCSFIVSNPFDMQQTVKGAFTAEELDDIRWLLEIRAYGPKETIQLFKQMIEARNVSKQDVRIWLDNEWYYYNNVKLADLVNGVDFSRLQDLRKLEIGVDDCDYDAMMWLGFIYKLFNKLDIRVDASESEREIAGDGELTAAEDKLIKMAYS